MSEYIVKLDWPYDTGCHIGREIVRCKDCKHFTYADSEHGNNDWCAKHGHIAWSVNGFCAWDEPRWLVCKCGEEIESMGGAFVVCPSCGRRVIQ